MKYCKEDIYRIIEEEDVKFIRLQFTDIHGHVKNLAATSSQLDKILNNKYIFDGAAIEGFATEEKSELRLYPDLNTFTIFPWRPQAGKVARFICDVYNLDGTPYMGDSRYILKKVLKDVENMGYTFDVGPECEFFLFDTNEEGELTTNTKEIGGYFDIGPIDKGEDTRRDLVLTLEDMGFEVNTSYHECEPAQHEIDFKNDDALNTADNVMTFRMAVRIVGMRHGLHATFMPKPRTDFNGSGMTLNMAMYNELGKNVFADADDKYGISELAYSFIAGILEHLDAITAICNPIINSYKRLSGNKKAPIDKGWSTMDRSMSIRVPANIGVSTVSLRTPDSASNPYLAIAVCIAAGMDGIKRKLKPAKMGEKLGRVPLDLKDSLIALENDDLIRSVLGEVMASRFIVEKMKEREEYSKYVTDWELKKYLNRY